MSALNFRSVDGGASSLEIFTNIRNQLSRIQQDMGDLLQGGSRGRFLEIQAEVNGLSHQLWGIQIEGNQNGEAEALRVIHSQLADEVLGLSDAVRSIVRNQCVLPDLSDRERKEEPSRALAEEGNVASIPAMEVMQGFVAAVEAAEAEVERLATAHEVMLEQLSAAEEALRAARDADPEEQNMMAMSESVMRETCAGLANELRSAMQARDEAQAILREASENLAD